MSEPQLPPRPAPPQRPLDVLHRWVAWVGLGRLVLAAVSVGVVSAGLFWLVRTEPPPVEASLPMTTATTPAATLPPPDAAAAPSATDAPAAPALVIVHVAGAVVSPGVHELDVGARVLDAVRAAGGPEGDADLDGLNLASPLVDGQRVYVPVTGEVDPASVPSGAAAAASEPVGPTGPLDLNTATAELLESLPGVGPATAAAIIDDRDRNGPFASVDDLDRVPGIGPAKLAALRDLVTV